MPDPSLLRSAAAAAAGGDGHPILPSKGGGGLPCLPSSYTFSAILAAASRLTSSSCAITAPGSGGGGGTYGGTDAALEEEAGPRAGVPADLPCSTMTPMSLGSTARLAARSRQYERNLARSCMDGRRGGAMPRGGAILLLLGPRRLCDPREMASLTMTSALQV